MIKIVIRITTKSAVNTVESNIINRDEVVKHLERCADDVD